MGCLGSRKTPIPTASSTRCPLPASAPSPVRVPVPLRVPAPTRALPVRREAAKNPPSTRTNFQHLTVSPTLRQELSAAKLPRLDPEFFQDTLPPNHVMASSGADAGPAEEENVELAPLTVPLRKRRWLLVALLFGGGAGIVFGLISRTTTGESPAENKVRNSTTVPTDVAARASAALHVSASEPAPSQSAATRAAGSVSR
jgi:hypothetical protein